MTIRNAKAIWNGTLKEGKGEMNFSDYNGPFTFASRFEELGSDLVYTSIWMV